MSDTIIKVDNLSKRFIIGHEKQERYNSLRDVIAGNVKSMFNRRSEKKATEEEFWALKDVSFEIKQGDRVGIIGRNGAGKSTLLKILSRITEPTTGQIDIEGRVASLLEVGTGFHPELTGRENIFLNGAILGMSRAEIRSKFDEIVAFAEVEKFLDTPVKRYSSGMYVRLAFAVAAHLEPEILIVDEVLAVGDAQFQKKCLGKMEDVSKNEGRTVLFVSHQLGTIATLCSKAILLKSGQVVEFNATHKVIESYLTSNSEGDTNKYVTKSDFKDDKIFISEAYTINSKSVPSEEFKFDEGITVCLKAYLGLKTSNLKLGVTLLNIHGSYITTNILDVKYEYAMNSTVDVEFTYPAAIIAPNAYSFRLALFENNTVYEILENVCPIKIIDTGTHLSIYEGINYGSVIFENNWKIN